jgi:hypothetical protein
MSRVVWSLILILGAAGLIVQVWPEFLPSSTRGPVSALFDLGEEGTVANWLSALLLGMSGLLALLNGGRSAVSASDRRYWHWLGFILLFLSLDEAVALHEQVGDWMGDSLSPIGVTLGWVAPWAVFVLVIGLAYWRFVARQDPWLRRRIVWAGVLYVAAALVTRFLAESLVDRLDEVAYQVLIVVQEVAEMVAIAWFAITVLRWTTDGSPTTDG